MIEKVKTERINVSLPKSTLRLIDKVWPNKKFRSRSSFLDEAARTHALRLQRASLKRSLRSGYQKKAKENLDFVSLWESSSNEVISAD
jgi:metal-responsive CopG/Arc/MetJ family transcriptional regulator